MPALGLLLAGLALAAPPAETPLVVDRVVARVDGVVITLSALTAETRLVLLDARNPRLALEAPLTPALLSAVLRSMVHRALLTNEMRRLQLRPAPVEEITADLDRLARRFEDREAFRAFLVDIGLVDFDAGDVSPYGAPAGIVARLRMEREVSRFVDVRIRPSLVTSDRELRACFEANRARFEGRGYEVVQDQIRLRLRGQKQSRSLARLIDQLERRAKIRVEAPYDIAEGEGVAEDELGFSCPEATE